VEDIVFKMAKFS